MNRNYQRVQLPFYGIFLLLIAVNVLMSFLKQSLLEHLGLGQQEGERAVMFMGAALMLGGLWLLSFFFDLRSLPESAGGVHTAKPWSPTQVQDATSGKWDETGLSETSAKRLQYWHRHQRQICSEAVTNIIWRALAVTFIVPALLLLAFPEWFSWARLLSVQSILAPCFAFWIFVLTLLASRGGASNLSLKAAPATKRNSQGARDLWRMLLSIFGLLTLLSLWTPLLSHGGTPGALLLYVLTLSPWFIFGIAMLFGAVPMLNNVASQSCMGRDV